MVNNINVRRVGMSIFLSTIYRPVYIIYSELNMSRTSHELLYFIIIIKRSMYNIIYICLVYYLYTSYVIKENVIERIANICYSTCTCVHSSLYLYIILLFIYNSLYLFCFLWVCENESPLQIPSRTPFSTSNNSITIIIITLFINLCFTC